MVKNSIIEENAGSQPFLLSLYGKMLISTAFINFAGVSAGTAVILQLIFQ
jgi:hypothetical protein